jgi:hypothetical protein
MSAGSNMKVSGFAIARNVVQADYPLKEAILSILPLCDEIVIAVGKSQDNTRAYIESFNIPQLRIIDTVWNDNIREGGAVLADETNKAIAEVSKDSDWLIYIQADECIHEDDLPKIRKAMEDNLEKKHVDGLLFDYLHFYGTYEFLGDSRRWYKHEIRIIRNNLGIKSWKDAQGFRKKDDAKIAVANANGRIFHYGWVKHPKQQQIKQMQFHRLWHDDAYMQKNVNISDEFDYSNIDSLIPFEQTHPAVMKNRVDNISWKFAMNPASKKFGIKAKLLYWIEKKFGWRVGEYKNYKLVK